jgi:hypothetical protein
MSLLAIRASGEAASAEQKRIQERRRNLLIIVHQFLGYFILFNHIYITLY